MDKFGETVKRNFGFGCMRLPMQGEAVDREEFCRMIDTFLRAGFCYFDTAHGYLNGKSELAIRDCLTSRYPREAYVLADKLSAPHFEKPEDVVPLFEQQLKCCGVSYFDFYLFHALNARIYEKHKACRTFQTVQELKKQGKIRHIAMSFHDTAEVLDRILTEQPCVEAVQLQLNYLDYDDPNVQSKACYDVAVKHGKKVIVMEPVKGGSLVNLPDEAKTVLDSVGSGSYASYAIRYAASYPEVFMVLSGMGNMEMMRDNISFMQSFVPLSRQELEATDRVREIIRRVKQIPCTKCGYCMENCPHQIRIPEIFAACNQVLAARATREEAKAPLGSDGGRAKECVECGTCEQACPQKLEIRRLLKEAVRDLRI